VGQQQQQQQQPQTGAVLSASVIVTVTHVPTAPAQGVMQKRGWCGGRMLHGYSPCPVHKGPSRAHCSPRLVPVEQWHCAGMQNKQQPQQALHRPLLADMYYYCTGLAPTCMCCCQGRCGGCCHVHKQLGMHCSQRPLSCAQGRTLGPRERPQHKRGGLGRRRMTAGRRPWSNKCHTTHRHTAADFILTLLHSTADPDTACRSTALLCRVNLLVLPRRLFSLCLESA
jgi:hypothetical protein